MGALILPGDLPLTGGREEELEEELPRLHRSRSADIQALLLLILLAPTDVRVESRTTSTATLAWNNKSTAGGSIEIDRALEDGAFVLIVSVSSGTQTYEDTGLAEGTRYRYRLRII